MEETLIPDVAINNSKLTVNKKTYDFYCKRKTKEEANLIKSDLIANGCDAISRRDIIDDNQCYIIWWRKD